MKTLTLFITLFLSAHAFGQSGSLTLSPFGIGELKIGSTKKEVESILHQRAALKPYTDNNASGFDTAHCNYRNASLELIFFVMSKSDFDTKNDDLPLNMIRTSSTHVKTKAGIGVGSDKSKVLAAYRNNKIIQNDDSSCDVWVTDKDGNSMVFYINNNKVTTLGVTVDIGE